MLFSQLITNIGDGAFTLSLGAALYKLTGNIGAFGLVIIIEYIISFSVELFAGYLVDKRNPKKICSLMDYIRGISICLASIALLYNNSIVLLLFSVIIINLAKPFYQSGSFSITPELVPENRLAEYNLIKSQYMQLGQVLGIAMAGPILAWFGESIALMVNGLSFLIAGMLVSFMTNIKPHLITNESMSFNDFIEKWKTVCIFLINNKLLLGILVISSFDFLVINFINLQLVPIIEENFHGNLSLLSLFDGSFAFSMIVVAPFILNLLNGVKESRIITLSLLSLSLCFIVLGFSHNFIFTSFIFGFMGCISLLTGTVYVTFIQQQAKGNIKGRISSVRKLILSILSIFLMPILSKLNASSIVIGLIFCACLCFFFQILFTFIIRRSTGDFKIIKTTSNKVSQS
ncbi:MFS transporter [Bacillus cereus]|nr:MFS transporter [Bacillus cereus]